MYRFGERQHEHKRLYISLLLLFVFSVAAVMLSVRLMTANTHISKPPAPVIGHVLNATPATTTIHEPLFSLDLPRTWQTRVANDIPQPNYSWHGTLKDDDTRWINVYVDATPVTLAVNRVQPVAASGNGLTLPSSLSDNCTTFTGATTANQTSITAKWQGVTFLCDTGNYVRDVVGTSSSDGINNVTLSTATSGSHRFFFTFTDNSPDPDYSIFTNILKSFKLN